MTALWREDAEEDDVLAVYQYMIDTGQAWRMEGHVGRTAMHLIESGLCVLGVDGHRDYWGNYVPGRFEVKAGTKGSPEFAHERTCGSQHQPGQRCPFGAGETIQ